jgi:transcriptional regulator with XRE-family HTH domain
MKKLDERSIAEGIGQAIAKRRVAAKLTQEEVADALGVGNEAISRIERGIVMPSVARLISLARIFACETSELLTESSPKIDDQAQRLAALLKGVSAEDRKMIIEIVEKLTSRLKIEK